MSDKTWDRDEIVKLERPQGTPPRELSLFEALQEVMSVESKSDEMAFRIDCEDHPPITIYEKAEDIYTCLSKGTPFPV
jgi:hypothetical protein